MLEEGSTVNCEVDAGLMAELEALRLRRAEVERPPEPLVEPLPTREAPLAIPRADDELKVRAGTASKDGPSLSAASASAPSVWHFS